MHWQFGEMEFGEMKRNTSNWSNFCMLLRRAGLTASARLSCCVFQRGWKRREGNEGRTVRPSSFCQSWIRAWTEQKRLKQ